MDEEIIELLNQFKEETDQQLDKLESKINIINNKVSELEPVNIEYQYHTEIDNKSNEIKTDSNVDLIQPAYICKQLI